MLRFNLNYISKRAPWQKGFKLPSRIKVQEAASLNIINYSKQPAFYWHFQLNPDLYTLSINE